MQAKHEREINTQSLKFVLHINCLPKNVTSKPNYIFPLACFIFESHAPIILQTL